jgi:hypothetical protein
MLGFGKKASTSGKCREMKGLRRLGKGFAIAPRLQYAAARMEV